MELFKRKKFITKIKCNKCNYYDKIFTFVPRSEYDELEENYICWECRKAYKYV